MPTGQPQSQGEIREYTSVSAADTTTWAGARAADWVQIIGAGSTVLVTERGSSRTITTDAFEPAAVMYGPFVAFTSTTATRVRMGIGDAPQVVVPPTGLASGAALSGLSAFTAETDVNGALGEIYQDLKTTHLLVPVLLTSGILAAGTPLAAWADNASSNPGVTLANSKAVGVRWNNNASQTAVWAPPLIVPYEADVSADALWMGLCSKVGATVGDATTFTVAAFGQAVAALHDADADFGGTSSAIVGDATSKTVQLSTLTLLAANLAAYAAPAGISMSVKPSDGTLGTDDMILHVAFVAFVRKLRTT